MPLTGCHHLPSSSICSPHEHLTSLLPLSRPYCRFAMEPPGCPTILMLSYCANVRCWMQSPSIATITQGSRSFRNDCMSCLLSSGLPQRWVCTNAKIRHSSLWAIPRKTASSAATVSNLLGSYSWLLSARKCWAPLGSSAHNPQISLLPEARWQAAIAASASSAKAKVLST